MSGPAIATAAEIVMAARLGGTPLGPFDPALGIAGLAEGYLVQQTANDLLERRLGERVGHKIAGTNKVMQVYLGCDEPLAGEVFASTVHPSGTPLRLSDYRRVGIETEIAVRLGRDLPARPELYVREEVEGAVAEVMAAIEIVDDRYTDFRTVGAPVIVADNAFNAGVILGEPLRDWRKLDLGALDASTYIGDVLAAQGTSDALLGHPMAALLWLAERRRELGLGLTAGSFVSLGSITPVQWLDQPSTARIIVEEMGEVEVHFG